MKKLLAVFLISSTILLTCCSCDNIMSTESKKAEKEIVVLEPGGNWSPYGGVHNDDIPFWSTNSYAKAKEKVTVTFNGNTYKGTFEYSEKLFPRNYQVDRYSTEDNKSFGIRNDTLELVYFRYKPEEMTTQKLPDSQLDSIAEDFVKSYIDTSKYTLEKSNISYEQQYKYDLLPYNGVDTYAKFIVRLSQYTGEVCLFKSTMIHEYNIKELDSWKEDMLEIEEVLPEKVEEKIKELYGSDPKYQSHKVGLPIICKLPDGNYGLYVTVSVSLVEFGEDGFSYGSGDGLVLVVTKR